MFQAVLNQKGLASPPVGLTANTNWHFAATQCRDVTWRPLRAAGTQRTVPFVTLARGQYVVDFTFAKHRYATACNVRFSGEQPMPANNESSLVKAVTTGGALAGAIYLGGGIVNAVGAMALRVGEPLAKDWVGKHLSGAFPDLVAAFVSGGHNRQHDLLRLLRRAETGAVIRLLDRTILDLSGVSPQLGPVALLVDTLRARGKTPELRTLWRIRSAFRRTHLMIATLPVAMLVKQNGAVLHELDALVREGVEIIPGGSLEDVRVALVRRYVAWFSDAVTEPARFRGLDAGLDALAPEGAPAALLEQFNAHPGGFWDQLRLSVRDELKRDARARAAWDLDVQAHLKAVVAASFEEMERRLGEVDKALDQESQLITALSGRLDDMAREIAQGLDAIRLEQLPGIATEQTRQRELTEEIISILKAREEFYSPGSAKRAQKLVAAGRLEEADALLAHEESDAELRVAAILSDRACIAYLNNDVAKALDLARNAVFRSRSEPDVAWEYTLQALTLLCYEWAWAHDDQGNHSRYAKGRLIKVGTSSAPQYSHSDAGVKRAEAGTMIWRCVDEYLAQYQRAGSGGTSDYNFYRGWTGNLNHVAGRLMTLVESYEDVAAAEAAAAVFDLYAQTYHSADDPMDIGSTQRNLRLMEDFLRDRAAQLEYRPLPVQPKDQRKSAAARRHAEDGGREQLLAQVARVRGSDGDLRLVEYLCTSPDPTQTVR